MQQEFYVEGITKLGYYKTGVTETASLESIAEKIG